MKKWLNDVSSRTAAAIASTLVITGAATLWGWLSVGEALLLLLAAAAILLIGFGLLRHVLRVTHFFIPHEGAKWLASAPTQGAEQWYNAAQTTVEETPYCERCETRLTPAPVPPLRQALDASTCTERLACASCGVTYTFAGGTERLHAGAQAAAESAVRQHTRSTRGNRASQRRCARLPDAPGSGTIGAAARSAASSRGGAEPSGISGP